MGSSSIYKQLFGGNTLLKGGASNNLIKLMYEKKEFLILVFANLIVQLGITYYIMEKTNNSNISILPLAITQIIIIFVLILVPMPEYIKFIIFCVFSYINGIILSGLKKSQITYINRLQTSKILSAICSTVKKLNEITLGQIQLIK